MKRNNKNNNYSEDLSKEDNMTQEHENLMHNDNVSDNLSVEEDALTDEEAVEEETLQEKYDELNNNFLRLYAEFDNYRKRTLKEKMDIIKSGEIGRAHV